MISDFDLAQFDFEITSLTENGVAVTPGVNQVRTNVIASGTTNGIGWTITPTAYWMLRTLDNNSFNGNILPISTDNLHPSREYTITFDQVIDTLLVALANDNTSDSIDFQMLPTDISGNLSFDGTQAVLGIPSGGIALFENISSMTITNVESNFRDGYDLAFWAPSTVSAVPVPAAVWLFGTALLGFIGISRRRNLG